MKEVPKLLAYQNYQNQMLDGFERVLSQVMTAAATDLRQAEIPQSIFDRIDRDCSRIRQEIQEVRQRIKIVN